MKILLCCESEQVRSAVARALGSVGHSVVAETTPASLVQSLAGASALLVDGASCSQAVALLRDRGFTGRTLLLGDGPAAALSDQAQAAGADGVVVASPESDLARRVEAAIRRRRILIVDDSEIVAKLLRAELEPKGFEIQYAPSAEKAATVIFRRATRPDLILLDINMPKVDGAQFCRFVKKNDMFKSIKVLFCSGEDKEKVQRLVTECGADGYISKDEFLGKWIVDNTG